MSNDPWPKPQMAVEVKPQPKTDWTAISLSFALGFTLGIIAGFILLGVVLLGFAKGMST